MQEGERKLCRIHLYLERANRKKSQRYFQSSGKAPGTSRHSVHLANPPLDLSTLVSSSRRDASSSPACANRSPPWFSRSTPSAGTPRELSAKRQYVLPRRLFIQLPGPTPSLWPSRRERADPSPRVFSPLDNLQSLSLPLDYLSTARTFLCPRQRARSLARSLLPFFGRFDTLDREEKCRVTTVR